MDESPICALGGAMFKLPGKLDGLLRHGHMLPKGAEDEIPLIKRDLEEIISILQDHISRSEDPSVMVNCWMKEVRELSYDIEDCIDQYEHAADSKSKYVCKIPRRKFTSRKSNRLSEKLKQRLWMANKIREFSARVQEALQRHQMYNLDNIGRTTTITTPTYDASSRSLHHKLYREAADPVGIDAPMNKLEEWLIKDGEQKLKVVSIVGAGGIGKTTLANKLFCKLGGQFDCRAFLRLSQKPDMRRLLVSMLSQVRPHHPPDTWKVHNLIADIMTHLQDKRYLIVVDDVWATSTWDIVNCALPYDNRCSRILITTEIEDVAHKCCGYDSKYVFLMKPLSNDDSRRLFFNTAFGPQHECPQELSEVSNNIIRKCGGLPLSTVTIASLLASQMGKPEQWHHVHRSLGYGLGTNTALEGMKQVLNLCYNNLPHHLKACMLYLSIYEEDYIIWKDDLVKQWVAEGFICATEEKDKEEISRSYFDELVSRRMIQPVHINDNDEVLSCVVHHMVRNLITYKSIEENFLIAVDHYQTTTRLADKVRRLSLHFGNAEDATPPTNMRLSQVRTLAFFGVFKFVPSIVEFRLLQVLILHFWGDEESISFDLTRISELFRLRYLQVSCNVTLELRTQMRGLQYLETLRIDAKSSVVPSDIVHLPGLLHLNLPAETNLPNGIDHMTSLRTLGYFDLSGSSIQNVQSLGELTNLRDLQLTCYTVQPNNLKNNMQCLGSILGKLSNLKSITLVPAGSYSHVNTPDVAGDSSISISGDGLSSMSSPPALLQSLELLPHVCIFSSIPTWIGHLCKLCILKIGVMELARNVVDVLRGLPSLTVLSLYVHKKPAERIVFDSVGFSVLKYFKFRCSVAWLKFEASAMPNLRKLKLGFNAHGVEQHGTIPVGIEHLSGLKEISAKIGGAGAEEPDRRSAESALSDAVRMHPGRPNVNIQCVDRMFGAKDDKSSRTQEEEDRTLQNRCDIMEQDSNEQRGVLRKDYTEHAYKLVHSRFSTLPDSKILLLLTNKLAKRDDDIEPAIPVVDVYSVDPWQLLGIGGGEGEPWLYFCPQQEAMGDRRNRTTPSGYWKVVGKIRLVRADGRPIGAKKTMVFHRGRAPVGTLTDWMMFEYRAFEYAGPGATAATLPNPFAQRSEISLCRLHDRSTMIPRQFGAVGSPAKLLQEKEQYEILEEDSYERGGISENYSADDANNQADSRARPQCQIEETTGLSSSGRSTATIKKPAVVPSILGLGLDRWTPERQLQGQRPLWRNAKSHSVKKPRLVPDEGQARRAPVIIYDASPHVIHAKPSEFASLVQLLTFQGPTVPPQSEAQTQDYRKDKPVPAQFVQQDLLLSPAARLAAIERSVGPMRLPGHVDVADGDLSAARSSAWPGILSPSPSALLPLAAAEFFPPLPFDPVSISCFDELSPMQRAASTFGLAVLSPVAAAAAARVTTLTSREVRQPNKPRADAAVDQVVRQPYLPLADVYLQLHTTHMNDLIELKKPLHDEKDCKCSDDYKPQ